VGNPHSAFIRKEKKRKKKNADRELYHLVGGPPLRNGRFLKLSFIYTLSSSKARDFKKAILRHFNSLKELRNAPIHFKFLRSSFVPLEFHLSLLILRSEIQETRAIFPKMPIFDAVVTDAEKQDAPDLHAYIQSDDRNEWHLSC